MKAIARVILLVSFFVGSCLQFVVPVFAQTASLSATTPISTASANSPLPASPSATITPTPTSSPSAPPSPTAAPLGKHVQHSANGTFDVYADQLDFQATDTPHFIVNVPTATSGATLVQTVQQFFVAHGLAPASQATVSAQLLDAQHNPVAAPLLISATDQQTVAITLQSPPNFKPGTYSLVIHNGDDSTTQNFSWGVLALNFDKSVYLPSDTADLQMAVLDDVGKVLCDAQVMLTITDPNQKVTTFSTNNGITVNPVCQTRQVTTQADYEAKYQVGDVGSYAITLSATTPNGTRTISDTLHVQPSVPFTITRSSATRIYPPNIYPMNITLTANQDFAGVVTEVVPNTFTILPATQQTSFSTTQTDGNQTKIMWVVSAKKGQTLSLGYRFQAPNISPQFYVLGPLQLIDTNGAHVFAEQRQWQIAADVTFPATAYLSNTASAKITSTTSWQLVTTAPSSSNTTTSTKQARNTTYFQWQPGVSSNTTSQSSAPTTPNGKGFIYDTALDTTIPTGNWIYFMKTTSSSATGTAHVVVCAWKVTVSGGAITSNSTIFPSSAACQEGTANISTTVAALSSSVTVSSVPATSFTSSQYLYVEYWLRVTSAGSSNTGSTSLEVNAGSADEFTLPGSSSNLAPNAPSQDLPANSATGQSTTPVFKMTATDPESDGLQYKVTIYSNSGCSTVVQTDDETSSQTGWSGQNATIHSGSDGYTSGTQGVFTTQTALSSNTQYWWKSSAIDPLGSNTWTNSSTCNTFTTSGDLAPNSPTSLSQIRVTAGTTIASGGWTNETQAKFEASVSDADATENLKLCVEVEPNGTAFSNTGTCGTGVAYSGTPVTANVTITGLSNSTTYHWQARVEDQASQFSSWVSNGGSPDFGVDTTVPSGSNVYDGSSTGVEQQFNAGSLSSLSANWTAFTVGSSGLNYYQYAIGTTVGGTDVVGWTNNGTTTSFTANSLTLHTSKIYYVSIEAVSNANSTSTAVTSQGQQVAPTLTFGVSPTSVTFNNLNAANSYTDSQNTTITTSTNAYNGYTIRFFTTQDLTSTLFASTIGGFNGGTYTTPAAYSGGDTGFGVTSSAATVQGVNKFQPSAGVGTLFFAPSHTGPGDIVADHTANVTGSPISNEQFTMTYKVVASPTQPASPYTTTAIYTITPQY